MNIQDIHDSIADAVNMQELVQELGLPVKVIGANMCIICPNPDHSDKNHGSCIVFEKNVYCFACLKSWNAIDLVMEVNNCNFMDAVSFLSDMYGLQIDFKRDEERVEPLIIPKTVFAAADINDTAAFKKLYEESPNAAIQFLSCCIYDARKKCQQVTSMPMPEAAHKMLQQRIDTLSKANHNLPRWRTDANTHPLRIK